jgi:tetratricopeptide (TPR) repeat protein/tRNA A-37 threonylcarbamoyl transferase component Bud32
LSDLSQRLQSTLAGRYRIECELGRGGMATVFLAEDLKHGRRVAIKVLDPEVAAAIGPERFLREIETVARLSHPHVLTLHDSGQADGLLFFVMPYVTGESLRQRLERDRQLPLDEALRLTREVADALDHAHRQGVVHRDIKPENILVEEGHALVADFGIARAVAAAGGEKLTATGVVVGTPAYMSPEQAGGSSRLDGRSDQYSLGCVLYEMLAGQPPFTGPTVESLVHQHLSVAPHPVTAVRSSVPLAVERAITKALAKTPADRFATPGEFAVALTAETEAVPRPRPRGRRWWAVSIAPVLVTIVAVAAWQQWWPFEGGQPTPARKEWVLVAEFEGPAGDTTLATAARLLVSAALDQSKALATVPRDQIQLALQQAGKPANTRVSAEVARELAYRRAVRAVLEGDIARIGQGYSVVLRIVDAESLGVVLTERGTAKSEDALIPALGRLAERLRHDLGERRSAIAATRPMTAIATPSFEAYRLFVRATRLMGANEPASIRTAVLLLREALALDPGFFDAWHVLGVAYYNLSEPDSTLAAFQEARRLVGRATLGARLMIEGRLARVNGDQEAALVAFDRLLKEDPSWGAAWISRGNAFEALGRYDEALESVLRAEEASPVGSTVGMRLNKTYLLCELGRADDARRVARTLPGILGRQLLILAEMTAADWATAESLAVGARREAGIEDSPIPLYLASALAGRGAFRAAADAYSRAERARATFANPALYRNQARRGRVLLAVMSGRAVPLPPDTWSTDTSTVTRLTRGLRAAIAGDQVAARRMLAMVRARPERDRRQQGATPTLLEAWIRGLDGRLQEVIPLLEPVASLATEGEAGYAVGLSAVRWTLADAYEGCGQRDSAVVWLERITSDPGPLNRDAYYRGAVVSVAHQRLVLIYARMGRAADAERHLAILERWWDRPDDVTRPMLEAARAAVKSARGMAGHESRRG